MNNYFLLINKINGPEAIYILIQKAETFKSYIVLISWFSKSNNLYESIYHMGAYGKIYPNLDKISNKIQATQGFTINPNQEKGSK